MTDPARQDDDDAAAPGPRAPDWLGVVEAAVAGSDDEFDLSCLAAGDWLRVTTRHTVYTFHIVDPVRRDAIVATDRPDRPAGPARIMGCTFGLSSTIKPDHLFCGGNLEFTHRAGEWVHTTTAILKVEWLRANPGPQGEKL